MRKILLALCLSYTSTVGFAQTSSTTYSSSSGSPIYQEKKMGVGLGLGETVGVTANYFYSETRSVDAFVSFGNNDEIRDSDDFSFYATHLWRRPRALDSEIPLGWYFGVGAKGVVLDNDQNDDFLLGPRAVIGIDLMTDNAPFEIFAQLAPTLYLVEDIEDDIEVSLGARVYF